MSDKRFNIKPSAIVDDVTVIIDSEKQYTFPILDSTLNFMFCKALNELAEENEQLKQAYNDAKKDVEKKEQILKDIMNDNLLIQDIKKELEDD